MMSPKTKALYDEWENKAIQKGIEQGKRALLRKQLMLRFGTLPADAEERIEHASLAELELWPNACSPPGAWPRSSPIEATAIPLS